MSVIKESKNIDMNIKSEPWTETELVEFRKLMNKLKAKVRVKPIRKVKRSGNKFKKQTEVT